MVEPELIIAESGEVRDILRELCDLTGMGFAAVARVTEAKWVACQVLDRIEFGLTAGGELEIQTTICDEIREHRQPIFISCVANEPIWRIHPTPILYGFQSYVSVPLVRRDNSFFGTLCAVDPAEHIVETPEVRAAILALAERVVRVLEAQDA